MVVGAPGRHERMAERTARTLRERMYASIAALEYPLPRRFYVTLSQWTAQSGNICVNSKFPRSTPFEIIEGKRVDAQRFLTLAFGDIVVELVVAHNLNSTGT